MRHIKDLAYKMYCIPEISTKKKCNKLRKINLFNCQKIYERKMILTTKIKATSKTSLNRINKKSFIWSSMILAISYLTVVRMKMTWQLKSNHLKQPIELGTFTKLNNYSRKNLVKDRISWAPLLWAWVYSQKIKELLSNTWEFTWITNNW